MCLSIVSFERLFSTFQHTRYRMSLSTLRFGRFMHVFLFVSVGVVLALLAFRSKRVLRAAIPVASCMCAVWVAWNLWILGTFYRKSMAVVRGMQVTSPMSSSSSGSISCTAASEGCTDEKAMTLASTALRIAICTFIPLVSSVCIAIVVIFNDQSTVGFAMAILNGLDLALNSFCIMSLFNDAKPYYDAVLGRLHAWLFQHLFEV